MQVVVVVECSILVLVLEMRVPAVMVVVVQELLLLQILLLQMELREPLIEVAEEEVQPGAAVVPEAPADQVL